MSTQRVYHADMAEKTSRWNLRVPDEADRAVRAAAEVTHLRFTDFVTTASLEKAERVLGDRTELVMSRDEWDQFVKALDEPPAPNAALRKLMTTPTVFD